MTKQVKICLDKLRRECTPKSRSHSDKAEMEKGTGQTTSCKVKERKICHNPNGCI